MRDPRITQLAKNLINYSVKLQKGERLLVENYNADELTKAVIEEAFNAGGIPFVNTYNDEIRRILLTHGTDEQFEYISKWGVAQMTDMQAYIGLRGSLNTAEMSSVPAERMQKYAELCSRPIHHNLRVKNTKWCVLRYPNASMAQLANMSTEEFEDFYFRVCNLDYLKMSAAMDPLVEKLIKTEKVRITGVNTDISFSIKGISAKKCAGDMNIPDGEAYTAPVRDSVNGIITYNTPAEYQGVTFENISLTFEKGKIIDARANLTERINKIFDTDEGARYVGEFALGVHPYITKPMKDTLFDEKISGSIHFTPGSCYEDADNGNDSAIHWDLVLIQTPEYGGGCIYFDDVLVRKDGRFIVPELECLNPENLL